MLIPLTTEQLSTGQSLAIIRTTTLAMSPIYTFFLRATADLIDAGHAWPLTSWSDDLCEAVYAELDGEIIGHIVYSKEKLDKKILWITLSAVAPEYRGRGIYKILHGHFENIARDLDCLYVASQVHKNNTARLRSAAKEGMTPTFHTMGKRLS